MKTKKNQLALVIAIATAGVFTSNGHAQVTIGSENAPHPGALLDLRQNDNTGANSTKGLLLPRVNLTAYDELTVAGDEFAATGMIVWNTNALALRGVGTYQWDGTQWLEMKAAGIDYGVLPNGTATFSGKTCFDIVYSNDDEDGCALLTERASQAVDFSNRTPQGESVSTAYTGVQVYTFTTVGGAVSKLRFAYEETVGEGFIVESVVPSSDYATATGITSAQVTVSYKTSLQEKLRGKTRDEAFKLKLYAIYNANSDGSGGATADRKAELTIRLQDCACCGAYVTSSVWKEFACHNLGADETANPFTPSRDINGSFFQWGSQTAALTQKEGDDATPFESGSWNSTAPSTFYGSDGTTTGNQNDKAKSATDPCPDGYRVPTCTEWQGVTNNNPDPTPYWVGTSPWTGRWLSPALLLPIAGLREVSNGYQSHRGNNGYYWSTGLNIATTAFTLNIYSTVGNKSTSSYRRALGESIRCITEN